jgi:hypothetical protein
MNATIQTRAKILVSREIRVCLSSLISTVAHGDADQSGALGELIGQAVELALPVLDFESAAEEAGWELDQFGNVWRDPKDNRRLGVAGGSQYLAVDAEDACQHLGIEPHEHEVFEHWAVSDWLADKLEAKGEKIGRDFAGMTVWARTTTGQSIAADEVIQAIVSESGYAELPIEDGDD